MSLLKFYTADGSDPRGKQKIWYCCHPRDFALYFKEMSSDLCAVQKCSIWYETEPDSAWDDELEDSLALMQLFVVPITERFLTQPSRARQQELAFALEHNIPILPVMLEENLDELYAGVFGELQYLDRVRNDETAIPYGEKMKNYLDGVLVGDSLAEKVRAEFDATIFMSYRKKDRRYAHELMRLIHDEEQCRDVSIWYDEFLVPGRNFNGGIIDALKDCDLFALTVTPNLTEPGNYVMTTEYVCARDEGKPILPAEMVATDRTELAKGYDELPAVVDARDAAALSNSLHEALRELPLRERERDRQHNYMIGLAFLNGIGVEKDYGRALKLITEASDAGLAEATDKLAVMYRDGIGVQRSAEKALELRERAVKRMERSYRQNNTSGRLIRYLVSLFELANQQLSSGRRVAAFATFKQMEELCRRETQSAAVRLLRVTGLGEMGKMKMEDGRLDDAEQYLLEAERFLSQEDGERENAWQICAASVFDTLGRLYMKREYFNHASEAYCKSLELRRENARDGSASARGKLAATLSALSYVWRKTGSLIKAKNCLVEALELRRRLAAESEGNPSALKGLASACSDMAMFYCSLRTQARRALPLLREQRDIYAGLAESEMGNTAVLRLALAEYSLADVEAMLRHYGAAERGYRRGIELYAGQESVTDIAGFQSTARNGRAVGYELLGDMYRARKKYALALENYHEGAALLEGDPDSRQTLARLYGLLGRELMRAGSPDAADYCQRQTELLEQLVKENEATNLKYALKNAYTQLAQALAGSAQAEKAEKAERRARALNDKLANAELRDWHSGDSDTGTLNIIADPLSNISLRNFKTYYFREYRKAAHTMLRSGSQGPGKAIKQMESKDYYICDSLIARGYRLAKLGLCCEKLHWSGAAQRLHRKALALGEKAVACRPYGMCYDALGAFCYNLGMLGRDGEHRDLLKRSYFIFCELCRLFPKDEHYSKCREIAKKGFIACSAQANGKTKKPKS